jgi:AcrR family transcriptional regulator
VSRRSPRVSDTQERLKNGAVSVFASRGYTLTGVDHIVEEAGTTRGAFYYYFASKHDVAEDIQLELWADVARHAEDALDPDDDLITNVKRAFTAHVDALRGLGENQRAFLCQAFVEPALAVSDGHGHEWGTDLIREFLIDGMGKGQISPIDPDAATALLIEAFQGATCSALDGTDASSTLGVVEALLEAVVTARGDHHDPGDIGALQRGQANR